MISGYASGSLADRPRTVGLPLISMGSIKGKFANVDVYKALLSTVFTNSAKILRKDAFVYVRTDRREPTVSITRAALKGAFPSHQLRRVNQPITGQTQTRLFGHNAPRFGEVDFILTPPK